MPNTGSMVELSFKFGCDPGQAVDLISEAFRIGLVVEGVSFHVGSQCTNFENFVQALNMSAAVMREAQARGHQILAEPGRFLVATAAISVARVIGKAVRDGKTCYYIDDSVYNTFSGIIFDHCQYHLKAFKKGATEICAVFGQTCDGLDTISQSEELPDLAIEDLVYSDNIGAYSNASATCFNGFPPAKVVHVNE